MAKTPDGHIWVATRNGLARFDPRRVSLDTEPLPAIIEQVLVNRREFPISQRKAKPTGEMRLPPGSGQQLEFRCTAISLVGADTLDNLVAYLREHAAAQLDNTPVQGCLDFPPAVPDCRISAIFRRNLVLVVKEALNNALKHSQASQVRVQLQVAESRLHLRIEDNGRGLDTSRRRTKGNGLGNMERRIRDLGGGFQLRSELGQGVQIHCDLPLK